MKQELFVIYDLKSKTCFSQIMAHPNDYVCKRSLISQADRFPNIIKQCPGDFAVIHLGSFEDEKPLIIPSEDAKEICFSMTEVIDYVGLSEKEGN